MTQWNRGLLKEQAKIAFKCNYWRCVLVAFVLSLLIGSGTGILNRNFSPNGGSENNSISQDYSNNVDTSDDDGSSFGSSIANSITGIVFASVFLVIALIFLLIGILLFNPLEVGGNKFFMSNMQSPNYNVGDLFFGFKNGFYGNTVITLFLRDLFIGLWSLLLVIPGIYKSYEYYMVAYILADHPEMSRKEAFARSKEMMMGQKWNAFVLDLSFLGWIILTGITCGIVGLLWTNPYINATKANLYLTLRDGASTSSSQGYEY